MLWMVVVVERGSERDEGGTRVGESCKEREP